jgi:DNA-binding transcriptional LysR family regulator
MELRHLRAFIAVAEELHFGRAADRLHIAQPPLSQQIRQLEAHLGVRLFDRSTRSVRLTSAGEALLDPARRVIEDAAQAERAARAGGRGEYGRVTLAYAGASSRFLLPQLMRAVRADYPNLELVMRGQTYANTTLALIADREIDLGFVRLPFHLPGLKYRPIEEESLLVAVPDDHPLAGETAISLSDLADEPFVSFPRSSGSTLRAITHQLGLANGFSPRVVQEAPDSYTIHSLVAAGVGVTITLSSTTHIRQPGVTYLPILGGSPRFQSALAWHQENDSPALAAVLRVADATLPRPDDSLPLNPDPTLPIAGS